MEAVISLDQTPADIEHSGGTISGEKSEFLKDGIKMVAFICGSKGRTPEEGKVSKPCFLQFTPGSGGGGVVLPSGFISPRWLTGNRRNGNRSQGVLGLCVYYRIWIRDFAIRANPLYDLTRGKKDYVWGERQQAAMDNLKEAFTNAPALKPIDYGAEGMVVLSVDSGLIGWGAILQQEETLGSSRRHPSRYENGLWTAAERRYDSGKLECRGLLRALKKLRYYLHGINRD